MSGVVGSHIMFGEFKSAAAFIIIFWLSLRCVAKIWGLALRLNMTRARPMFFFGFPFWLEARKVLFCLQLDV